MGGESVGANWTARSASFTASASSPSSLKLKARKPCAEAFEGSASTAFIASVAAWSILPCWPKNFYGVQMLRCRRNNAVSRQAVQRPNEHERTDDKLKSAHLCVTVSQPSAPKKQSGVRADNP